LTITCRLGHPDRAPRQRDGDDHRQQLGGEPDRQRDREQERLEQGTVVEGVDQQHEQDERDRQARQQDSEAARAAFERRRRRRLGERAREPAVEGARSGRADEHPRRTGDDAAAHEDRMRTGERLAAKVFD